MSWVTLVAKIFATTTLVAGAAYSARQASKQEKVERYARKIEMELVAIDPFIASIEEERRSLIKEEIAKKIFGNADAMEISASDEAYPAIERLASIEDITKSILSFVSKGWGMSCVAQKFSLIFSLMGLKLGGICWDKLKLRKRENRCGATLSGIC